MIVGLVAQGLARDPQGLSGIRRGTLWGFLVLPRATSGTLQGASRDFGKPLGTLQGFSIRSKREWEIMV